VRHYRGGVARRQAPLQQGEGSGAAAKVQAALGIAAGVIALAAYLYLLGGMVVWLRLFGARLPTDDALRALDSRRLLALGLKAFLFELLMLGLLSLLAYWTWARMTKKKRSPAKVITNTKTAAGESLVAWVILLQALLIGLSSGALFVAYTSTPDAWFPLLSLGVAAVWVFVILRLGGRANALGKWGQHILTGVRWLIIAVVIFVSVWKLAAPLGVTVLVILVFLLLSENLSRLPSVRSPVELVPAVLVIGGGLSLIVGAYIASPPVSLDRAEVLLVGGTTVIGGYVGLSGDGVFLATCTADPREPEASGSTRLRTFAPDQVKRLVLGGPRYVLDFGKDPSLFDLGRYMVHRDHIKEWGPTVSLDLRGRKLVCGQESPLRLEARSHAGHQLRQGMFVAGPGALELSGDGLSPVTRSVERRQHLMLPLVLERRARRELRCGGFDSVINVKLRLREGLVGEKHSELHLAPPATTSVRPTLGTCRPVTSQPSK
jgi:hypothetical protein